MTRQPGLCLPLAWQIGANTRRKMARHATPAMAWQQQATVLRNGCSASAARHRSARNQRKYALLAKHGKWRTGWANAAAAIAAQASRFAVAQQGGGGAVNLAGVACAGWKC